MDAASLTPVLIGRSIIVNHSSSLPSQEVLSTSLSPSRFLARAIHKALQDASQIPVNEVKELAVIKTMFHDRLPMKDNKGKVIVPQYTSLARATARKAGMTPTTRLIDTHVGGETPQAFVNAFAHRVSQGMHKEGVVVLVGGELLATLAQVRRAKIWPPWGGLEESHDDESYFLHQVPGRFGDSSPGASGLELKHGMRFPRVVYPMLDQALRVEQGRSTIEQHTLNGQIFSGLSQVAASLGPSKAWFPVAKSWEEIMTVTPSNRWIGFPYTKSMNSVANVDQAGALVMTSLAIARKLGVPESQMVFLLGAGDAHETGYFVSLRPRLGESFAQHTAIHEALNQANKMVDNIHYLDLYSCFPVAVTTACRALGIDPLSRALTTCGGLPYCGGPGSSYAVLSIASMMDKLRQAPQGHCGLVTANGMYLTKHACGVYSNKPPSRPFQRRDPKVVQEELDRAHAPLLRKIAKTPNGLGKIETYTVDHSRGRMAHVIGTMAETGERFIASCKEEAVMDFFMVNDMIGHDVVVETSSSLGAGESEFRLVMGSQEKEIYKPTGIKIVRDNKMTMKSKL